MPVLFNTDSGAAENLPDDKAAKAALEAGTHEVPMVDPNGEIGSVPHSEVQSLMAEGYKQPSTEQLNHILAQAKYSSTGQQLIGAAEQIGKGAFGPVAIGAERALGVSGADIRGREESKGTPEKMLEQGAGLLASEFIPGGQSRVLSRAAEATTEAAGIARATSTFGKIGTAAAKASIENALYQGGDEISKALVGDPNQTAGNAVAHIGLAGVIGAGFGAGIGAVPPVWEATLGPKTEQFLRTISDRANGVTMPVSDDLARVLSNLEKSGKEIAPEIRAGLSDNTLASNYFKELRESGTTTGDALRETIQKFQSDVGDQLQNVFREEGGVTAFEAGERAKQMISQRADELNTAISAKYADVMPHLEAVQIPDKARLKFYDKLIEDGQNFGAKGSPAEALFKTYGERALAQDSVAQLKELATELRSEASVAKRAGDFKKQEALEQIRGSIKEFQDSQVISAGKRMEAEGIPGAQGLAESLLADRKVADKAYAEFMDTVGEIASVGKLGKVRSHGQLQAALENIPSAKLADKLFDAKNIEGLRYLQKNFPEVLEQLSRAKKTALIEAATTKGELMHNQLLNSVNKIPKEVRALMFSPEEMGTINASGKILRESHKRIGPSGTATTMDKLMQHLPAGVGSIASMLLGHNPVTGYLLGHAGKFIARDAPDAAKASLLKFLGSPEVIEGSAFKSLADYFHAAQRGEVLLTRAAKAVVKSTQEVLPKSQMPDEKSRKKLDKRLEAYAKDPSKMLEVGGKVGHYAPDHSMAMGQMVANTVNYLNGLRPQEIQASPLDTPVKDHLQQERFDRALDIAQQPLIVLHNLNEGMLTPENVADLQAMYPSVYQNMVGKLNSAIVDQVAAGEDIPYTTRLGLSTLLGQPMDSTLSQPSIMAAQLAQNRIGAGEQEQEMRQQKAAPASQTKPLTKMAQSYQTSGQARQQQRQSDKV
jgi:hypothetical protein